MLNSLSQIKEISLTDFRKVISQTLNSEDMQIINVKKGKKKIILDIAQFADMYKVYQNEQWQTNLTQLQDVLAPQVINEIGHSEYNRINTLADLDEVVASAVKLKNNRYEKTQN